jgi:hypothetical protein
MYDLGKFFSELLNFEYFLLTKGKEADVMSMCTYAGCNSCEVFIYVLILAWSFLYR